VCVCECVTDVVWCVQVYVTQPQYQVLVTTNETLAVTNNHIDTITR